MKYAQAFGRLQTLEKSLEVVKDDVEIALINAQIQVLSAEVSKRLEDASGMSDALTLMRRLNEAHEKLIHEETQNAPA